MQKEQNCGGYTQQLMRSYETEKHPGGWLPPSASWDLAEIAVYLGIFGVSNQRLNLMKQNSSSPLNVKSTYLQSSISSAYILLLKKKIEL